MAKRDNNALAQQLNQQAETLGDLRDALEHIADGDESDAEDLRAIAREALAKLGDGDEEEGEGGGGEEDDAA
jgi:hypothetical protein